MEREETIRAAALNAALRYYGCTFIDERHDQKIPRHLIVDCAVRFEEYIREGT